MRQPPKSDRLDTSEGNGWVAVVWRLLASTQRNRERERRAHTRLALHPDPPAVEFYKLPAQGEPESRTLNLLRRRPHLAELLEDFLLILRGDADPGVADRDLRESILWHCA